MLTTYTQVDAPTRTGSIQVTRRPCYHKTNFDAVKRALINRLPPNQDITHPQDTQEIWSNFHLVSFTLLQAHTPLSSPPLNPDKPWINKYTRTLARRKLRAWKRYRDSGLDHDYAAYRSTSNNLTRHIRERRRGFEKDVIVSGGKRFFSWIRRQCNSRSEAPRAVKDSAGALITDQAEIAEVFSNEFQKVYTAEPPYVPDPHAAPPAEPGAILEDIEFSVHEVGLVLSSLDRNSAPGPDGIPAAYLQACATQIAPTLCRLFSTSLATGSLPGAWKEALVTPIFKKGAKTDPLNYRPISLTSTVGKVMERMVVSEILDFAVDQHIIPEQQHGFMPGRSTVTSLLASVNCWSRALDEGTPIDVIYLDFSKAFDRVPHHRLLQKLHDLGIRGKLLAWIQSYLTDRTFRVRISDTISSPKGVLSGVPQGSVLGPLLFILYTSDLGKNLTCRWNAYADDTKIFANPVEHHQQLQNDLVAIQHWSQKWLIPLNGPKCCVLHLGKRNPRLSYYLGDVLVESTRSHSDLGVIITEDLKWNQHVLSVTKKANSVSYLISQAFSLLSGELIRSIMVTYVRPGLEYACPVWSPYYKKDIAHLEKPQRRLTKRLGNLRDLDYGRRCEALEIPTLEQRRLQFDLVETYKLLNNVYTTSEVGGILTTSRNVRLRGHEVILRKERTRTNVRAHFLSNRVVNAWNRLPGDCVSAESLNAFRARLERHLNG